MLQGSLQKIDFQDLLPDLTFQLRDPRFLRPFLPHAGKRPLPKLLDIAAPAIQFLAAHFQTAGHQARWLSRTQPLHCIQFELLAELPSRPHPSFPFRCILGLNWLSQIRGPLHNLHSGSKGLSRTVWKAEPLHEPHAAAVRFTAVSPDGDGGFPGNLSVTLVYRLTDDNELQLEYTARTDKATPVNLTNHSYFNLGGGKDVLDEI